MGIKENILSSFTSLYSLIVLGPLLISIICGFFSLYFGYKNAQFLTTLIMGVSCLLSFLIFFDIALDRKILYIHLFDWLTLEYCFDPILRIKWGFLFDSLSISMCVVVTTVSFLVHLYSCEYMKEDPHVPRFMAYLSLFTFFMLMLVTADNFFQLFFGWEGVGLCSFLLISFWYTRIAAVKAALKAIMMNRIGDFGLLLSIALIYLGFKTLDYAHIFLLTPYFYESKIFLLNFEVDYLTTVCLFLFLGSVGKSAQLGLHTWLPDAMEGPTPVSALIHAATMVTAGIFLIIRCSIIFEYAPTALIFITIWGAITAFFAATIGLVQNDLKKVIAYSTCSQLGYMTFACGLSGYSVAFFHLANHAFFKALLFLCAGAIIHALKDEQDMRKMGGLYKYMPYTFVLMTIASLSLIGFPFFSGYYSKDLIIELAYAKYTISGNFAFTLGVISAFFTAFYSWRLIYLTFFSTYRGPSSIYKQIHEAPLLMLIPLFILAIGSLFSGLLTRDLFVGFGSDFFQNVIFVHPKNLIFIDAEFIPIYIKYLPTILSIFGIFFAIITNTIFRSVVNSFLMTYFGYSLYTFLVKKWYFDYLYNSLVKIFLIFCYEILYKTVDKGLLEFYGPESLVKIIYVCSKYVSQLQTGYIMDYLRAIVSSLFIIIFLYEIIFIFDLL